MKVSSKVLTIICNAVIICSTIIIMWILLEVSNDMRRIGDTQPPIVEPTALPPPPSLPVIEESREYPPPEYKIIENGVEYSFLDAEGDKYLLNFPTKGMAIEWAWINYKNSEKEKVTKNLKWVETK